MTPLFCLLSVQTIAFCQVWSQKQPLWQIKPQELDCKWSSPFEKKTCAIYTVFRGLTSSWQWDLTSWLSFMSVFMHLNPFRSQLYVQSKFPESLTYFRVQTEYLINWTGWSKHPALCCGCWLDKAHWMPYSSVPFRRVKGCFGFKRTCYNTYKMTTWWFILDTEIPHQQHGFHFRSQRLF